MFASKPRGSRIIYVAASARELPEEVQQWLGRAAHRAARSPHVYDALALLANGARPVVMIVSMEAVDWSEMGFFDLAARMSRGTRIFVVGHDHDAAKLEDACKRGAEPFDEEAAGDALSSTAAWSRGTGMSDILAASLPASPRPPAIAPVFKPAPPEPVEDGENVEDSVCLNESEASAAEAETGGEASGDPEQPIPFPWALNPNRPQRIPPKKACENEGTGPGGAGETPAFEGELVNEAGETPAPLRTQQAGKMPAPPPTRPAELTAEELSALMGRPTPPGKQAREGRA